MGVTSNTVGAKFANISKGKISIYNGKGQPPTIGDGLEGHITNIAFDTDVFEGKKFEVIVATINDGKDTFNLKIRFDSGYGRQFALKVLNLDINQKVNIQPTYKEDTKRAGMFINQNGTSVKQKYSKDNPGNLPPLKETTFKGETVLDNTEQLAFLKAELQKIQFSHPAVSGPASQLEAPVEDDGNDPLPF